MNRSTTTALALLAALIAILVIALLAQPPVTAIPEFTESATVRNRSAPTADVWW